MAIGRILTYTGKWVYPYILNEDDINIRDIAHGLACVCRYSGQCSRFYSVAEHSVYVASLVPDAWKLAALLHDAPEAYLGDLARPIKQQDTNAEYRATEARAVQAIRRRFWLPGAFGALDGELCDAAVHRADMAVYGWEVRHLRGPGPNWDACERSSSRHLTPEDEATLSSLGPACFYPEARGNNLFCASLNAPLNINAPLKP